MIHSGTHRANAQTAPSCASRMSHGFTLIEALITMAIVGIVMGGIYGVFISSNRSYHTQDSVAEAQQGVRVGIEFMVQDIRMAGLDPTGNATDTVDGNGAGIKQATATRMRFTADMDMDGIIEEDYSERITYEYDAANNELRQCLDEGTASQDWETLIEDVNPLTFSYLDADDNNITVPVAAGDLDNIRTVVMSVTCQGTGARGHTFTRTLNTRVRCRNL